MAVHRVWDAAGGTPAGGPDWADAWLTLSDAEIAATPGTDVIWIAKDHDEGPGSIIITFDGSNPNVPQIIYSVDRADDSYATAVAPQLNVTTVGSDITLSGPLVLFGIHTWAQDNTTIASNNSGLDAINCIFEGGKNTSALRFGHQSHGNVRLLDCTIQNDTGTEQTLLLIGGITYFENVDFTQMTGAAAGVFRKANNNERGNHTFVGCDINILGDTDLVDDVGQNAPTFWEFIQCKLRASMNITTNPPALGTEIRLWNCSDGTDRYRTERHQHFGLTVVSTANDLSWIETDDSVPLSHLMTPDVANAPSQPLPFRGIPLTAYVEAADTPGTVTFDVECLEHNSSLTLTDKEIHLVARFLKDSGGTPLWGVERTLIIDPSEGSGTTVTLSSASWNGSLTGKSKFKLSITTTAKLEQDGHWEIEVVLGADITVTYDPKVIVTVN